MKYYMAGIKGAGVSALALLLSDRGNEIVGFDDAADHRFTEDALLERGIRIYNEITDDLDPSCIVVYSPALKLHEHPVLLRAQELGCQIYEYQEMLGKLTSDFRSICVSGCHGKTTTTAMLSHIMDNIEGCNYLIGDGVGHGNMESEKFIVESCEYRRHFLAYDPDYAIITNIEMDHTDYYKSMDDMVLAYQQFADKAREMVIVCGDDPYTHRLDIKGPHRFYGIEDGNDIQARNVEFRNNGTSFDLYIDGECYGHFDLPLFGKHMLLNSLATIAVCYFEGYESKIVANVLRTFKGAQRRFKETFIGNNVIIDDYAHHPTEVRVTILGARQKYPDKQIIGLFKAHTFSRVERFADEFAEALNLADKAYVMDINYDRENPEDYPGISAFTIIEKLDNGEYIEQGDAQELLQYDNAVILFMSSKEIYLLEDEYKHMLEEKLKD